MTEQDIFAAAIKLSGEEREAFLESACGTDEGLRRDVESLLRAHDDSGVTLKPPQNIATPQWESPTQPGTVLAGRYKLLEAIGDGGMGSVWLAEQKEPVKRKVAIKLIKAGMDSKAVLARFEAERQALAVMDHPHIAKVFDGGMTEQGRPFFVMELVKGIPLSDYCDQARLTVRERLELFGQVCSAVQHAHQKGIIHRDLKPSNILVTEPDGRHVTKVIDFGLAKALHGAHALTDVSLHTSFGTVIGTPLYMAPEQLGISALDVDTRSDLYSLGVILYELLTGTTPIERQLLKEAAWDEIRRLVHEEEPQLPSMRLSSSVSLPSVAARRHVEPAKLTKLIRGELDWIIMKTLEKDRNRRYETASALALDIQRYLAGETVLAAPPSRVYRLRKFVRRHRGPILAASLLLLALLAGIAGTTWGLFKAQKAAAAERVARTDAQKKQTEAERQRARAEQREQEAIDAVQRFGDAVANNPQLKNTPQFATLRKTLLKEPLGYFRSLRDRLQADRNTRPEALARLARAAERLGHLTYEIGERQDALQVFEEARAIWERLVPENPTVTDFQSGLAGTYINIGILLMETGKPTEALQAYEQAKAIQERLARENPTVTDTQHGLAKAHHNIGVVLSETGKSAEAVGAYEQARAILERLARENPSVTEFQYGLAKTLSGIGKMLNATGKPTEALAAFEQAKRILEQLARENPTVTDFHSDLARTYGDLGVLRGATGTPADALAEYERSREINERLARENPTVSDFQSSLGITYHRIGSLLRFIGKPTEALEAYEQAKAIQERLTRENPTVSGFQRDFATTYHSIGFLFSVTGKPTEALEAYAQAKAIQERLASENPSVTDFHSELAKTYHSIASLLRDTGKLVDALAAFEQARTILERLARENPSVPEFKIYLGGTLNDLATIHFNSGRFGEARDLFQEAVEHQRRALADNPDNPISRQFLKNHHNNLLAVATVLGDESLAAEARRGLAELAVGDPQIAALDQRMAKVLAGEQPQSTAELQQFGRRAYDTQRFALAARFFNDALTSDSSLTENRQTQVAYNAACSAALAAAGQDVDDPRPDDTAKAKLRSQALACLEQELEAWTRFVETAAPPERQLVVQVLTHWQNDTDLTAVRGEAITMLPESEQEAWRALWTAVDQVRAKTAEQPTEPQP